MSLVKNKSNIYVVLRHDFSGTDVVVATCLSSEKADDLVGEYTQLFLDKGFTTDEFYFYATISVFYDS